MCAVSPGDVAAGTSNKLNRTVVRFRALGLKRTGMDEGPLHPCFSINQGIAEPSNIVTSLPYRQNSLAASARR